MQDSFHGYRNGGTSDEIVYIGIDTLTTAMHCECERKNVLG